MVVLIDEKLLDDRLTALEKSHAFSPRVVAKIETHLRNSDDAGLFRINPLRFAADRGIVEAEAIDLFLHATKAGLFTMNWGVICPNCGDIVQSFASLGSVESHFECRLCAVETAVNLDDYICVSFDVAAAIRPNKFFEPENLSIADYLGTYRFGHSGTTEDGKPFRDYMSQYICFAEYVGPDAPQEFTVDLAPGTVRLFDFTNQAGLSIPIVADPERQGGDLLIDFAHENKPKTETATLFAGKNTLKVVPGPFRRIVAAYNFPQNFQRPKRILEPALTGKRLFASSTFRDLFRNEKIEATDGISIRELTILFTDLKGSTELYDRVGDLRAFQLVSQHFDAVGRIIHQHGGAIVKTIGDAVMANFMTPLDAVRAATGMLDVIAAFNRELHRNEIILKIGVHTGAAIAVTQNDRLDYFGQTVNVAARVQGLAEAEEICITSDVEAAPGVRELISGLKVQEERPQLKGVKDRMLIHRLRYREMSKAA